MFPAVYVLLKATNLGSFFLYESLKTKVQAFKVGVVAHSRNLRIPEAETGFRASLGHTVR